MMNEINHDSPQSEEVNLNAEEPGTSLQRPTPYLLHIQSGEPINLPDNQTQIMLGKPNNNNPPDVDLSGLPDAEIVSRQHALIHIEAETYYIEDLGSSNGTYVNNSAVARGERQEISSGDVLALGKEDKVTFIFKLP
ncbi:Forkhead-associated protein [Halothece sp. PCC 7418]|uniref:FHA domain-containing protein n=1 Tax=Halothece sp. (strain PCC 7418) TaxID=65093 RepID=UPI0002A06307|nr:FHA domain-containing protein [Halothece sp. PCC 7418]AFZ45179.1 Forkhead-associated protein [Halothece sp. PCC 7418]